MKYKTQGAEAEELYVVKTPIGTLRVTSTHAILLADGRMIAAKDLTPRDLLMGFDGKPVSIVGPIQRALANDGQVHNVLVDTPHKKEHLLVANGADGDASNGVVVGDLLWQNRLGAELNAVLMRQD